jgi:hypothetical protein
LALSRGGVSHTRVRIFKLAANRGVGEEVYVIYDAKHIGSAVLANDSGGAYWTLPINHPANKECVPLLRHYKIERLNHDTDTYDLVGAGLLMSADVTNDEIVYNGSDYMALMDMHYTPVLGATQTASSPLSYPAGNTKPIIEKGNTTITADRSASALRTGNDGTTTQNSVANDWNSNDTEIHLPVGNSGIAVSGTTRYKYRSAIKFDLAGSSAYTNATRITKAVLRLYYVGSGLTPPGHISWLTGSRTLYVSTQASDVWANTTAGAENSWVDVTPSSADLWTSGAATYYTKAISGSRPANKTLLEVDITGMVQAWKAGATNNGLRLATGKGAASSTNSGNTEWVDKENTRGLGLEFYSTAFSDATVRPQLYIEWEKDTNSSNGNLDLQGVFATLQDAKAYLDKSRCNSPLGDVTANSASNDAGRGEQNLPRTPNSVYITSQSRNSGLTTAELELCVNRIDCTFDEVNQKYVIKGYVQYEKVDEDGAAVTATQFYDYVNNRSVPMASASDLSNARPASVDVIIETSPGGIAFAARAWAPQWGAATGGHDAYSLEIPFHFEVYKSGSITADIDIPSATAPAVDSTVVWTAGIAGISFRNMPTTPQYKVPILAADGQAYEFSAYAVVTLNNATPSTTPPKPATEIVSASSATAIQSASPMALRNETLQNIFTRFVTDSNGAFNIPNVDGVTVGRLNWATIENVEPGATWPSNTLRYFTSGEQLTSFLRNMCEKQMNVNDAASVDGVSLPDRAVFNFVGVRRANGTPADGSKLFVHPTMGSDDAGLSSLLELNYPGEIDQFRYVYDGRVLRNDIQVIASSPFLTGTYTNMTGVRLTGSKSNDIASQKDYGFAPMLMAQGGFIDSTEADLEAKKTLEQRRDLVVASALTVQLERDVLNPFSDIFLGDAIKINIRRDGISPYEPDKNPYPNIISTVFVVSGIVYKYAPDGSEDIQFQLLSGKFFSAGKNASQSLGGGASSVTTNVLEPSINRVGSLKV